jgi:hypothetical protein
MQESGRFAQERVDLGVHFDGGVRPVMIFFASSGP